MTFGISAIIPTANRPQILSRTIHSVAAQSHLPKQIIVIDASENDLTKEICESLTGFLFKLIYVKAKEKGAACQRVQGIPLVDQPFIWFLDDDIILDAGCIERLWKGFYFSENVGAVNAMITNQCYTNPGRVTQWMYRLMHGSKLQTYAGKIIGPAWNLLPEDEPHLPEYNSCEWLNTTCTMYRKDALPSPVFSDFFFGYSLMEDVELSVKISRSYSLLNCRSARIFHDSQSGSHKHNWVRLSCMELVNRHYIMSKVLRRTNFVTYLKLFIFESFGVITNMRSWQGLKQTPQIILGKLTAILVIMNLIKQK